MAFTSWQYGNCSDRKRFLFDDKTNIHLSKNEPEWLNNNPEGEGIKFKQYSRLFESKTKWGVREIG